MLDIHNWSDYGEKGAGLYIHKKIPKWPYVHKLTPQVILRLFDEVLPLLKSKVYSIYFSKFPNSQIVFYDSFTLVSDYVEALSVKWWTFRQEK